MFGSSSVAASDDFPIGMWTIPEIGYYGLTKKAAIEKGFDAEEGVASYDACLRGRVFAPDGMLKLVFDKETRRILVLMGFLLILGVWNLRRFAMRPARVE